MAKSSRDETPPKHNLISPTVVVRFTPHGTRGMDRDGFEVAITEEIETLMRRNSPNGIACQERAFYAAMAAIAADMPPDHRRSVCVAVRGYLDGRQHEFSFDFGTVHHPADRLARRLIAA